MIHRDVNSDEDQFFNGFLPVWALTLFGIAILFILIFISGIICHFSGCRRLEESLTEQHLLTVNSQSPSKNFVEDSKGF